MELQDLTRFIHIMAKQPERAYLPLVRTQPDTRFYCFPETTETSPCLSSKPHSEEGGERQKKRRREDPEEGPNSSKRLRISTGQQPPHVEELEKAEDSSEAHEDSGTPGSSAGSRDTNGSCSGSSSSGGVESSDHSSARISSSCKTCLNTYSTGQMDGWLDING